MILAVYVFISFQNKDDDVDEIDITDTGFKYDVAVCDRYFELVWCIIDKDTNVNYTKEMRVELKSMAKDLQKERNELSEEELSKICSERLEELETNLEKENINSFGCYTKVN